MRRPTGLSCMRLIGSERITRSSARSCSESGRYSVLIVGMPALRSTVGTRTGMGFPARPRAGR